MAGGPVLHFQIMSYPNLYMRSMAMSNPLAIEDLVAIAGSCVIYGATLLTGSTLRFRAGCVSPLPDGVIKILSVISCRSARLRDGGLLSADVSLRPASLIDGGVGIMTVPEYDEGEHA